MKLGSTDIPAFRLGSTEVKKIYLGSTEVFSLGFDLTAGNNGASEDGWISATAAAAFGASAYGSVTGDTDADGGTAEVVVEDGSNGVLYILSGSASASTITIDGTDYTLTFSSTTSGYDIYSFPFTGFTSGNTYTITIT